MCFPLSRLPAASYVLPMTVPLPRSDHADLRRGETEAARAERGAREARLIAEADASIAAGRVVTEEAFNAWVDSIGTDHELPVPQSGR